MISFDEKDRRKAFGVYSGCPCSVKLGPPGLSTEDKEFARKDFDEKLKDLISQWHSACEGYCAGPTVGPRIQENWNKSKKLRYGKNAYIRCVYDQSSGGPSYCKLSLREEKNIGEEEFNLDLID